MKLLNGTFFLERILIRANRTCSVLFLLFHFVYNISEMKGDGTMKTAHIRHRVMAYAIDFTISIIIMAVVLSFSTIDVISVLISGRINASITINLFLLFQFFQMVLTIGIFVFIYYTLIPWRLNGQTIGKRMFRIRTVKVDGTALDMTTIIIRELIGRLFIDYTTLGLGMVISYLVMLSRKDKRSIHDIIAGTKVIDI